jgi:diguanylate cyclase (GGDEF)-like protein
MNTALRRGRALDERHYVRKDKTLFWSSGVLTSTIDKSGTHQGFSKIMRDVTDQKDLQKIIMHRSTHDYLTSLPNRRSFEENLIKALKETSKKNLAAILFLDFNNFKTINDQHGHKYGDLALIEIAHRLTKSIRAGDMVARLGGDEFVILLRGFENKTQIARFAGKILRVFRPELVVGKKKFVTTVSIGIAVHPEHGKKAGELLHHSDMALYDAKKGGKNKYVMFGERS